MSHVHPPLGGATERAARARLSLEGLSVGDAFGERFLEMPPALARERIASRRPPGPPWAWTDDTAMARCVVEELFEHGCIVQGSLAARFAAEHAREPWRGYGPGARRVLTQVLAGTPWAEAAAELFEGAGSLGNGGAMRAAPIGAFHAGDLSLAADEARRAAATTHAHPEGGEGAAAAAVAAAWVAGAARGSRPEEMLEAVHAELRPGPTREGLEAALALDPASAPEAAARRLGNGSLCTAPDTLPFALWCAARHLGDYEGALWTTVSVLGDADTNAAIVGGIVVLGCGPEAIPAPWRSAREPIDGPPDRS